MRIGREHALQALSLVLILVLWAVTAGLINLGDSFPPPTQVVPVVWDLVASGDAFPPLFETLARAGAGFFVGLFVGVLYGIIAFISPRADAYLRGLITISLFLPTLIIIFVGVAMFGRGFGAVTVIVALAVYAEIGVYARDALKGFDPEVRDMATSYNADLLLRAQELYLPYLVPVILVVSRMGFTLAWKAAFLCEVFGIPSGLGWEVRDSYMRYDMAGLLAWLALFIISLLLVEQLIRAVEKRLVRW